MQPQIVIGCRLCLSTEPRRSYFSMESTEEFLTVKIALSLEADFRQMDIYPNHICQNCKELLTKFQELQTIAQANESFILQSQDTILSYGLEEAKELYESKTSLCQAKNEVAEKEDSHREEKHETQIVEDPKEEAEEDENTESRDIEEFSGGGEDFHDDEEEYETQVMMEDNTVTPSKNVTGVVKHIVKQKTLKGEGEKESDGGTCILCNEECISLKKHEKMYHDDVSTMDCPICKKVFNKNASKSLKSTVKYHIKLLHTGEYTKPNHERQPCPMCGKSIKAYSLSTHIRITHATERLECPHKGSNSRCNKIFKHQVDLQSHLDKVHCNINVICPDCGKTVKKSSMKDHKVQCTPTEEQRLAKICPVCKKIFASKGSVALHMKTKHGPEESKKQCPECGVEVKHLDHHIKIQHTEQGKKKTINCTDDGCKSMFRTKQAMLTHYKHQHTDEREQCTICGEWLKNLDGHMRTTHKTGNQFPCDECGKIFYNTWDRRVHFERIHLGIKYLCPECGQSYQRIKDHMKSAHDIQDVDMHQIQTVKTK